MKVIAKGQDGNKFIITVEVDTEYLKYERANNEVRLEDFSDEELLEILKKGE